MWWGTGPWFTCSSAPCSTCENTFWHTDYLLTTDKNQIFGIYSYFSCLFHHFLWTPPDCLCHDLSSSLIYGCVYMTHEQKSTLYEHGICKCVILHSLCNMDTVHVNVFWSSNNKNVQTLTVITSSLNIGMHVFDKNTSTSLSLHLCEYMCTVFLGT